LHVLVAGEPGLALRRDGVDVVGGRQRRHADLARPGPFEQAQHDVAGAFGAPLVDDAVEGLDPLGGLLRVDVGQLAGQAVADHRALAFGGHGRSFALSSGAVGRSVHPARLAGVASRRARADWDDLAVYSSVVTVRTGSAPAVRDITAEASEFVRGRGDGLLHVFVPHATAGVAIIETGAGSDADLLRAV